MAETPIIVNVTGGLQDQCGFKVDGKYLTADDYKEIGSLHNYRKWEDKVTHGEWVKPVNGLKTLDVINPATEEVFGRIALGDKNDVDAAVEAAYSAFETFGFSSVEERISLLEKILEVYQGKYDEIAETISSEMGAPIGLSKAAQAATGLGHFSTALETLKNYKNLSSWYENIASRPAVIKAYDFMGKGQKIPKP